jgi:GTP-binding protein Era
MAVVGATNVGKSTLVNKLVGAKVSIVSPKVQTTRCRIMGVATVGHAQIVLIDTPGLFKPRGRLDQAMVSAAWQGARHADAVVLLIDSAKGIDGIVPRLVDWLRNNGRPAIAVLNKIDLVPKPKLLELAAELGGMGVFDDVFMVSAKKGDGVEDLFRALVARTPEGPWHFPEDQISDMPMYLLASEITREQIYLNLQNELPYTIVVETERWQEQKDGSIRVDQIIFAERDSQKGIVIGKGGRRIQSIGAAARLELERILERRVHLFLTAKVAEKWRDNPRYYELLGLSG